MIGETITVWRGATNNMGERETTDSHDIVGALAWGIWSRSDQPRAESAKGAAELYVDVGTDLRHRDRITRANGQKFLVVAGPLWDQPHLSTGHRSGYAVYQLEAMNG